MNPFLYDVLRVVRNRGVLLITMLTTLLSFVALSLYNGFSRANSAGLAIDPTTAVILIMGIIYAFFVPVLGIQTGYSTYARDRATGTLEAVLVRPVTRVDLIVSRYLAVGVASALALAAALGLLDLLNFWELGVGLPLDQLTMLFGGLLVEAVAFAGLLFLLAHVLRSPGAILGSAVVVFVLIDVVWFFLLLFVGIVFSPGGPNYGAIAGLEYMDPAGFPILVLTYIQGGFLGGTFSPPGGVASIGISPGGLVIAGIFWSTVPFLLALLLARKRD